MTLRLITAAWKENLQWIWVLFSHISMVWIYKMYDVDYSLCTIVRVIMGEVAHSDKDAPPKLLSLGNVSLG